MKTFTKILLTLFVFMAVIQTAFSQQQIQFNGLITNGFGLAGWNADGTGPEPAGTGHLIPLPGFGNLYYYGSSRDYVSGDPDHGLFQFLPGMTGFPQFTQALADHGYSPEQVVVKYGLTSVGDDEEGLDWFVMGNHHYSNHYFIGYQHLELDGEPMLALDMKYLFFSVSTTGNSWFVESDYSPVTDISDSSSAGVQAAAQAFLDDLGGKEIKFSYQCPFAGTVSFTGNGRSGAYYNVTDGILTTGHPTLPFQGLYADNEGFAGWDADGTGPEPSGDGHLSQQYYCASVDYDGINPHPAACLGHFLEGSSGFLNTLLQLQYRGFEIGDLKMKLGLNSLGPDVEGEDWGYENGLHWCNYYNNHLVIELNGEPILTILADTNKLVSHSNYWTSGTTAGKVYDISENAAPAAQFVAQSFLKDMGTHYLNCITYYTEYVTLFSGNGRDGAIYQITEGKMTGLHKNMTFVPPGIVSGTWTAEGSPYYVDGHLEIANGETLIIEPGVKVAVRGPYHFTVQGCVKAQGTADEKIVFTRSNPNLYWDGFDYYETPSTNDTSVFDHCLFEYGKGLGSGDFVHGGSFAIGYYDNIEISNSTFRYNEARTLLAAGGAIALRESDILIKNCTFHNNYSPHAGGAISVNYSSNPIISRCVFYDNYAKDYAGAVMAYVGANPIISNNLFFNNYADRGGALIFYKSAGGILLNNTIADNTAKLGGAVYLKYNSSPEIINNIIWNNQANIYGSQVYNSGSTNNNTRYYYNNIEGGLSGFGGVTFNGDYLFNIDEDPLFTNDPASPYMIDGSSPSYNAGTPDTSAWYYPQHLPESCLAGNPRICDGRIDMGAYEWMTTGTRMMAAASMALQIYPNPVSDFVYIEFNLPQTSIVFIQIFNAMGAKVAELHHGQLPAGQQQFTWDAGHLPKGLYFCRVQAGREVITRKVMKY